MYLYPGAKVKYPRITYYGDNKMIKKVNTQLAQVARTLKCRSEFFYRDGVRLTNSFEARPEVTYSQSEILSIYVPYRYICEGGTPTNNGNDSKTYDLRTGNEITFAGLFENYQQDKERILGSLFDDEMKRINRARLNRARLHRYPGVDSCESEDSFLYGIRHLSQSFYAYNLARTGIYIQPDWSHIIEACSRRILVSYNKAAPFFKREGILQRIKKIEH